MSVRFRKYILIFFLFIPCIIQNGCANTVYSREVQDVSDHYQVPEDKQLILYTSHKEEVYLPIVREFEDRTGIWVEVHSGGTTQMFDEIREKSVSESCDVMFGGVTFKIDSKKKIDICGDNILLYDRRSGELICSGSLIIE